MKVLMFVFAGLVSMALSVPAYADTATSKMKTTTSVAKTEGKMWTWGNDKAMEHFKKHVTWDKNNQATGQAITDACKGHEEGFTQADKDHINRALARLDPKKMYTYDEVWTMLSSM